MIHVENLTKSYGPVKALQDVSFDIAQGEIVGLLGPNGAGKTTIIKILTGYLQPDTGAVTIDGLDVLSNVRAVQSRIGYLPESAPLYPELSIQSYLKMMADLRAIPASEQVARISDAVYATALEEHLTQPIGTLSKGFRQRVGLAQAILHRPALLILDEPTVGLDPTQIIGIRQLIQRLAEHSTVLFSTHILPEVEALCDRAIILMNGQVRADARLAELADSNDAVLLLDHAAADVERTLRGLPGVRGVEALSANGHPGYRVLGGGETDLCPEIYRAAAARQWPLRELRNDRRTLETVFNELAMETAL